MTPQRERRRGRERGLSDVTPNRRRPPPPAPPPSLLSDDRMGWVRRGLWSIGKEGEAQATTPVLGHTAIDSSGGSTTSAPTPSGLTMGTLAGTIGNSSANTTPATSPATSPGPGFPCHFTLHPLR
ncbi:hypothetical protein BKA70DRAFT_1233424 [Coprinopsis sp. MPI-PUGE-AT-0042]|nr:hypothetical protein BKA70DRAFT_1233424 [Coprinopsis sp. MPI-PUGE-AT-0042]